MNMHFTLYLFCKAFFLGGGRQTPPRLYIDSDAPPAFIGLRIFINFYICHPLISRHPVCVTPCNQQKNLIKHSEMFIPNFLYIRRLKGKCRLGKLYFKVINSTIVPQSYIRLLDIQYKPSIKGLDAILNFNIKP